MKKIPKENAVPCLLKIGGMFFALGGLISGIMSMAIMSIKSVFHIKRKVDGGKKYVELKMRKSNKL